jgi:signal transduction histidine kinase
MRWLREHPRLADGALGVALFVLCVVPAASNQYVPTPDLAAGDLHAVGVALLALTTLPLAWRRSHPAHVAAAIAFGAVAYEAMDQPDTVNAIAGLVAVYSASAWGSRSVSRVAAAVTAVALTAILALNLDDTATWVDLVGNYAIFATAWVLGDNVRQRRERLRSLEERAVLAEMNREEEARRAVAAERTRIARELHDVVAHSVSVMVVQAGAARRVLERDPAQAAEAMASIEAVGRQSLNEMRRLLGVLRRDDDRSFGRVPQPSIRHVDALVEQTREAGLAVELVVEGDPKPLAPGVDLSAYRIVQEALTNTLKHAGPGVIAEVRLCFADSVLELVVSDDGRGSDRDRDDDHAGHGLVGMQERVTLFGGELHAGNRAGGGFVVRARLPLEVEA